MSEKRFGNVKVLVDDNIEIMLKDKENDYLYEAVSPLVERLLNYLDVEMKKLKEENEGLKQEVENLQSNMMESLSEHRKYEKSLEEENKRKTNEIKLLRKQYSKIPKGIREVWKE